MNQIKDLLFFGMARRCRMSLAWIGIACPILGNYGARFYDASLGRWFVSDPMDQYNSPYIYGGNNPINMIDPSGMWAEGTPDGWEGTNSEGYTLPEVTIYSNPDYNFDCEVDRYGYNGYWSDYQSYYGLYGYSQEAYSEFWENSYRLEWNEYVKQSDGEEAVAKMMRFATTFEQISTVISPTYSGLGTSFRATRGGLSISPRYNSSISITSTKASPLIEQGKSLVPLNNGKNTIILRTPTKQIRFDLAGKAHGNIPTPHKMIYNKNFFEGQLRSVSRASKEVELMTQQDIRMIRKYLERLR